MPDSFDLVVLGGGPGGYVAAIRAAQLGLKTAIVEREHLGGICLNWGCIPTKALLRSAEVFHLMQHAEELRPRRRRTSASISTKVVERSRAVAKQLSNGVKFLMKKNKITVDRWATAKLAGAGQDRGREGRQAGAELAAKHIILATGARAREAARASRPTASSSGPIKRRDGAAGRCRRSLLVVGSGAIGIEFASFYRDARRRGDGGRGAGPHPAGRGRGDLAPSPQKQFEKQGMKILTSARR